MHIDTIEQPFGLVLAVGDPRIDAAVAIQFKDRMRDLCRGVEGRIILDLTQVQFVDSSGLGAIVAALKQMGPAQTLELAALSPTVEKVFRLTRMDKVFPIHDTMDTVAQAFADVS